MDDTDPTSLSLKDYYEKFFPFESIFTFFNKDNREYALEKEGKFQRYKFFKSATEFKNMVLRELPEKIHLGPVYESRYTSGTQPVARELVFDVDVTSYLDVRTCCSRDKRSLCPKCWLFCEVAIKILDLVLLEVYGFRNVMYVFSGGKGFHAWVLEENTFNYSQCTLQFRKSIIEFFNPLSDERIAKKHPILKKVYESVAQHYVQKLIIDAQGKYLEYNRLKEKRGDIAAALTYMWPRLDKEVTIQEKHVIKLPMCRHPATKRVCTLINQSEPTYPLDCDIDYNHSLEIFSNIANDFSRKKIKIK